MIWVIWGSTIVKISDCGGVGFAVPCLRTCKAAALSLLGVDVSDVSFFPIVLNAKTLHKYSKILLLYMAKLIHHLSCAEGGKSHEKTVSFDRETVFTYIKQTPVQTPRWAPPPWAPDLSACLWKHKDTSSCLRARCIIVGILPGAMHVSGTRLFRPFQT